MKDAFGQAIKVGDPVVYCTRKGSSQSLNVGVITKLNQNETAMVRVVCDSSYRESKVRTVSLRVTRNLMVIGGFDLGDLSRSHE
jgi:hypothetical protein